MQTQARMSEADMRLYNPSRDVAHNFSFVVEEVAKRLENEGIWPELRDYLKSKGVTQEDLGKACEGFMLFVASAVENPKETMGACLRRSGYLDAPEPAQIAYMAMIGSVMSGIYWVGCREATVGGNGPCLTNQDLREAGRRAARLLAMPRWKRRLAKIYHRFVLVYEALTGRTSNIRPTPLERKPCTPSNNPTARPSPPPTTPESADQPPAATNDNPPLSTSGLISQSPTAP